MYSKEGFDPKSTGGSRPILPKEILISTMESPRMNESMVLCCGWWCWWAFPSRNAIVDIVVVVVDDDDVAGCRDGCNWGGFREKCW